MPFSINPITGKLDKTVDQDEHDLNTEARESSLDLFLEETAYNETAEEGQMVDLTNSLKIKKETGEVELAKSSALATVASTASTEASTAKSEAISETIETVNDGSGESILTITDANYGSYVGVGAGSGYAYLKNIPLATSIVSFETTAAQKIYGIQFADTVGNGKRVKLVGKVEYACLSTETATGRFSQYLYGYLAGWAGSSATTILDAFVEFMAWNGMMYHKGY